MQVIDGDGHIVEDAEEISKRLPSPYKESGPYQRNRLLPPLDHFHFHIGETPIDSFQIVGPEGWLEFLDKSGIEVTVLYPTEGLTYGRIPYADWAIAYARAYNDWLYDTYLNRSPRFKGVALIPMQEPEAAAQELRRAVKELGMCGAMLPSTGLKTHLGSKEYWPVYAEAEKLNCALAVHGGSHRGMGFDTYNIYTPVHALGHPFGLMIAFGGMIFNGIFDKFPGLRIAFHEGGPSWLPFILDRFDRAHDTHHQYDPRGELQGPQVNEKASAYVLKHIKAGRIFVGCEGSESGIVNAVKVVGGESFIYCTDFPHEVNLEICKNEINELIERSELSMEEKKAILYNNAKRFYQI